MRVATEMPAVRIGRAQAIVVLCVLAATVLAIVFMGIDVLMRPLDYPRSVLAGLAAVVVLALSLRNPKAAMLLILWGLPLMGVVRRLFDTLGVFEFDPVLAIAPGVAAGMTLLAFHRFRGSIGHSLRTSTVTRFAAMLGVVFAVHALIGVLPGLGTDVGSAFFLLGPLLWYFLGRAYLDETSVRKLLLGSMVIGVVCGLVGFYQTFVGFFPFEQDWIARKVEKFPALYVGRFIRPFSTFSNPEEWTRYMGAVGTCAAAFLMDWRRTRRSLALLSVVGVMISASAIVISGVRTSVFGFVVSLVVVLWVMAKSRMSALAWLGMLAAALGSFLWLAPALTWREVVASKVAWMAFVGHTTRGIRAPLEEDSFLIRLDIWKHLFTEVVPAYPLGLGPADVTESYLVSVTVGTGILGGLLLVGVFGALAMHASRVCRSQRDAIVVSAVAILAGMILTSLSGNTLALYSVGPLGWALAGWLSTQATQVGKEGRG